MSLELVALLLTMLLNVLALAWGASKLHSSVTVLNTTVDKIDKTLGDLDRRVNRHDTKIEVLQVMMKEDIADLAVEKTRRREVNDKTMNALIGLLQSTNSTVSKLHDLIDRTASA